MLTVRDGGATKVPKWGAYLETKRMCFYLLLRNNFALGRKEYELVVKRSAAFFFRLRPELF